MNIIPAVVVSHSELLMPVNECVFDDSIRCDRGLDEFAADPAVQTAHYHRFLHVRRFRTVLFLLRRENIRIVFRLWFLKKPISFSEFLGECNEIRDDNNI